MQRWSSQPNGSMTIYRVNSRQARLVRFDKNKIKKYIDGQV